MGNREDLARRQMSIKQVPKLIYSLDNDAT